MPQEQFEQFFDSISRMLTDKMDQLKRELMQEQEHANECPVKQMHSEKLPTFQMTTHKKQFLFNEEVRSNVVNVAEALLQTTVTVEKAKSLLEEGEKLLEQRQNLYIVQIGLRMGRPQ